MSKIKVFHFFVPITSEEAPVSRRISSFVEYIEKEDKNKVVLHQRAVGFLNDLKLIMRIYSTKQLSYLFLTMPPFRGWWMCFLPGLNAIIDWRDGWSVAMRSGYGGLVKKRKIKALLAEFIEFLALLVSSSIITCTPGLYEYHQRGVKKIFRKKLFLVPNGHRIEIRESDFSRYKSPVPFNKTLNIVCAGKFSEYGRSKAITVVETLLKRYNSNRLKISLIGCDLNANRWISNHFRNQPRLEIEFFPAVSNKDNVSILRRSDMGIALIRDDSYELGTKAFDYVACGLPIVDYFSHDNNFKIYFSGCFDTDYNPLTAIEKAFDFDRIVQIRKSNCFQYLYPYTGEK